MCTLEKRGEIFFLTLTGDDEHRLNPGLIDSLRSALREAKEQSTPGSALITMAHGKFFSNGFDLAWAQSEAGGSSSGAGAHERLLYIVDLGKQVVADFISLPMPTIAAVTGHAAGAGVSLALCHDYVLMRSDRGVLYMSELDLGLTFADYFTALLRSKVGLAAGARDLLLKGVKVRAAKAVAIGIIDSVHDSAEATIEAAVRLGAGIDQKEVERPGVCRNSKISVS